MTKTIEELATEEFHARERVRAMEMSNSPTDYNERLKTAVKLAKARAAHAAAWSALNAAIEQQK